MSVADTILANLQAVNTERATRAADPQLGRSARKVRHYQSERMRLTHADLLSDARTRPAAVFFLEQLYGTQDFVERDAQFERIVPTIVRLFSGEVARTVAHLAELHALSERLDTAVARQLPLVSDQTPFPEIYRQAWQRVGEPHARERQVELVETVGRALLHYTQHPSLGKALKFMRLPARAAGLSALQSFLETGFDTFARLPDAAGFVRTIVARERLEMARLFST